MIRWLKRSVIALLVLLLVAATAAAVAVWLGDRKLRRTVELPAAAAAFPGASGDVERGHYLYVSRNCAECHGADGAGKDVVKDAGTGMWVHAPNITPAAGSVVAAYRPDDWARIVRHGVKADGHPAFLMPSEDYARLTDADLAAIVAYVRGLPPAEGGGPTIRLPLIVKALYGAGAVKDAAERIDHARPPEPAKVPAVTAAYGAYVAATCQGCHGEHLSGGRIPGAPPDWPAAANLTPGSGSAMARYPDAAAMTAMFRTGRRPDGTPVSSVMPFGGLKAMSDLDVGALYLH